LKLLVELVRILGLMGRIALLQPMDLKTKANYGMRIHLNFVLTATNLVDYSPNGHLKASARRKISLVHHDVQSGRVELDSI
jgi:hypothetical protein